MNSRRLLQTMLGLQIAVVLFAACAAYGLRVAPAGRIWIAAGVVIVLAACAIPLAGTRLGLVLGSLVPIALGVGGIWIRELIVLAIVFAALWIGSLVMARRLDGARGR